MKMIFILLLAFCTKSNWDMEKAPILKIARSVDQNEVHYFVNVDKYGNLNTVEPLKLLWKNHKKGGQYEDLHWIKKKYGYGVKMLEKKEDKIHFKFVAYDKKQFYIQKSRQGIYGIYGVFDNKEVELTSFFVNIQGGGFWTPNVVSVDIKGEEVVSNKQFTGELKP